jgi:hypothetical protein
MMRMRHGEQLGDAGADAAQPDDAERDAGVAVGRPQAEIGAHQARRAPLAGLDRGVALLELLEHGEDHRHGALGDAVAVRLGRRVAHQNAELGRRLDVDIVSADRAFGDDAQVRVGLHDPAGDRARPDRGADQGLGVLRVSDHLVFIVALRRMPVGPALGQFAAVLLEFRIALLGGIRFGENENLRVGHCDLPCVPACHAAGLLAG